MRQEYESRFLCTNIGTALFVNDLTLRSKAKEGKNMKDVVIIGGGVVGTSIARELSRYNLDILVVEKAKEVAHGTTKANSAIVHSGYDAKPGTLKSKFNLLGRDMMKQVTDELGVVYKEIGSLLVALDDEEMETVNQLKKQGDELGVEGLRVLTTEETLELEPNLNPEIKGSLHAPTAGIVGAFELAIAYMENAIDNGAELMTEAEVTDIEVLEDYYKIITTKGEIDTKVVVNAAGVHADKIHNMVADPEFEIRARAGQYYLLDKFNELLVNRIIFPAPSKKGKGVLVLPTIHDNILVGPDSVFRDDKYDQSTTYDSYDDIRSKAVKSVPDIPFWKTITSFTGLRAHSSTEDFVIGEIDGVDGFFDVAGIESPGLTAAPAIAVHVADLVTEKFPDIEENEDFNPIRRPEIFFNELTDDEKNELIKKDPRYGRIICRCERITEGEIVDAIHRSNGVRTLDGLKRRLRPGMGRCQGGFCWPLIIDIMARELGVDKTEITKDGQGSNIAITTTK